MPTDHFTLSALEVLGGLVDDHIADKYVCVCANSPITIPPITSARTTMNGQKQ